MQMEDADEASTRKLLAESKKYDELLKRTKGDA
jgi:hypothetical protein